MVRTSDNPWQEELHLIHHRNILVASGLLLRPLPDLNSAKIAAQGTETDTDWVAVGGVEVVSEVPRWVLPCFETTFGKTDVSTLRLRALAPLRMAAVDPEPPYRR